MNWTIFLTRHGQTRQNELKLFKQAGIDISQYNKNSFYELTSVGMEQAVKLGRYLDRVIGEKDKVKFVTSTLSRSEDTARWVANEMGIGLEENNHYADRSLVEVAPIDNVALYEGDTFQRRETIHRLGNKIGDTLLDYTLNDERDTTIAVLHKSVNRIFLESLGIPVPYNYDTDNCGLFVLEGFDKAIHSVRPYISNDALERRMAV